MDNPTSIVMSRLMAQTRAMDVTASNIANASTPGFRAGRMMFADWLLPEPNPAERRAAFVQDRATYFVRDPGPMTHTGNPLDLALADPNAFFSVQTGNGVRLTRAGHFTLSATGGVVDEAGDAVLDTAGQPLTLSPADRVVSVAGDGTIGSENGRVGKIGVVTPDDPTAITPEGGRLFVAAGTTTADAAPRVVQGAVEGSNVQPITEITRMTADLRSFQLAAQFIQSEAEREQSAIDKLAPKKA